MRFELETRFRQIQSRLKGDSEETNEVSNVSNLACSAISFGPLRQHKSTARADALLLHSTMLMLMLRN